jgi:hypothetical protein
VARLSTVVVAILVALAVPVSQFRSVSVIKACCCPDPDNCHCPDHEKASPSQPTIRACHNTEHAVIAPQLPAFTAPVVGAVAAPVVAVLAVDPSIAAPHPAPPPTRPDAPS